MSKISFTSLLRNSIHSIYEQNGFFYKCTSVGEILQLIRLKQLKKTYLQLFKTGSKKKKKKKSKCPFKKKNSIYGSFNVFNFYVSIAEVP